MTRLEEYERLARTGHSIESDLFFQIHQVAIQHERNQRDQEAKAKEEAPPQIDASQFPHAAKLAELTRANQTLGDLYASQHGFELRQERARMGGE